MTNSRKKTFVFLAIVFALLLCLAILMLNNSTNTVKAKTISSEQNALFNERIKSDDTCPSELEMYNTYSDFETMQEEASYTIEITRENYIEEVLYENKDVSEISADESATIVLVVNTTRNIFANDEVLFVLEEGQAQIMISSNVCIISEVKCDLKIHVGIKDVISSITYYFNGELYNGYPTQYSNKLGAVLPTPQASEGMEFKGWYDNKDYTGNEIKSIEVGEKGDKVFYGREDDIEFFITLDPTEGYMAHEDPTPVTLGQRYVLTVPERIGYYFDGWFSEKNGGVKYTNSNGVCLNPWSDLDDIILYAHWRPRPFTLYFNTNGGDELSPKMQTVFWDSHYTLPVPTRQGYTFLGWYLSSTGGVQLTDNQGHSLRVWQMLNMPTIYAHWQENDYRLCLYSIHLDEVTYVTDYSVYHPLGLGYYTLPYDDIFSYEPPEEMTYTRTDGAGTITYTRLFSRWEVIRGNVYDFSSTNKWIQISTNRKLEISMKDIMNNYYPDLKDEDTISIRAYYDTLKQQETCVAGGH